MKEFILKTIDFYQKNHTKPSCNFIPTCSEYTKQAITKYGLPRGAFLGFRRVLKCHPFRKITIDTLK